jgi:hypothetical protein
VFTSITVSVTATTHILFGFFSSPSWAVCMPQSY